MKDWLPVVVGVCVIVAAFAVPSSARAAEPLEITHCYSGTFLIFHDNKEVMSAGSWAQNGIIMSHTESKMLNNAVVHCEGVQRGLGPDRSGYGLCKIVDDDGDMIVAETPYSISAYDMRFLDGTGKWKGIKGTLRFERFAVRSKPGKGAMPGTYQGCDRQKGSFELSK